MASNRLRPAVWRLGCMIEDSVQRWESAGGWKPETNEHFRDRLLGILTSLRRLHEQTLSPVTKPSGSDYRRKLRNLVVDGATHLFLLAYTEGAISDEKDSTRSSNDSKPDDNAMPASDCTSVIEHACAD